MKARFDELIHAPLRLRICAILAAVDSAGFSTLREMLDVSDSVLSKHVSSLESAGYVDVRKHTVVSRVHTSLALTGPGRRALRGHLAALKEIVSPVEPAMDALESAPSRVRSGGSAERRGSR